MNSLEEGITAWSLVPDGRPFATATSLLAPVRDADGRPAMLKLARLDEEVRGGRALVAWSGRGTVPVLRHSGPALLLPRATGGDLVDVWRQGGDEVALDRIADLAGHVHAVPLASEPFQQADLVPLERWFAALRRAGERRGGLWAAAWHEARALLDDRSDETPLHGDLHHGNVLDFGAFAGLGHLGWRSIDPKGLRGDRAFDFACALLNPVRSASGGDPRRMRARAQRLAARASVDAERVLAWTQAFATLSAAWAVEDGTDPASDLAWRVTARRARALRTSEAGE